MVVIRNLNAPKNFLFTVDRFCTVPFSLHMPSPSHFSPILLHSLQINNYLLVHAKKRNSQLEPLLNRTTTDQEDKEEEEEEDEFQEETFVEGGDDFEDEFEEEDTELHVGDGSGSWNSACWDTLRQKGIGSS